ncbi:ATP-binding protein [Saccharothrix sp. Mg75]|uniref:ATP-binding protein n=1 Tax=Saccharothrix sp. Mg75 TaxID=3445357 RepID=UPI003EE8907A
MREHGPGPLDAVPPTTRNEVVGVVGSVVQAGSIGGDVHVHPAGRRPPTPRQLPLAPARFVGRAAESARLTEAVTAPGGAAQVVALAGPGGMGKTWLAVHWAHRHLDLFPDGQLFVDLRGFGPDGEPMETAVAVRGFLDALGVEPGDIPADLHAQAALYRSLVADRRVLVVLDNAATAEQVVSLLPGGRTCTVLVTCRRVLTSLISRYGAHHVRLDPLTTGDGHVLLTDWLGAARVAAEPDAAAELVDHCRGFALALGLVAGRAHTHPHVPLARLAAELREIGLDALDDDDPAASLPTVLSWSYRALPAEQRRVFGLLGVAPGFDTGLPVAASLTGLTPARTRRVLGGLVEASLLDQDPRGRYAMHDLVRACAATVADEDVPADERDAAVRRALDHLVHTALAADRIIAPHRLPVVAEPPAPGTQGTPHEDTASALAWLDVEHANLLAAQQTAVAAGHHRVAWLVAWSLDAFHGRRGHLRDRVTTWRVALRAAVDPTTRTRANRFLGRGLAHLGQHDEAVRHLHRALALAEHHRDPVERAHTHRMLSWAWRQRNEWTHALEHAGWALELFRVLDQPVWEADALNQLGWHAARLGDHDAGRAHCLAALDLYDRHPNPDGEAAVLVSLGYLDHHSGHHERAVEHYLRALDLYRDLGNTCLSADALENLGHPYAALGRLDEARGLWDRALELYRQQERHDDATRVRELLGDG